MFFGKKENNSKNEFILMAAHQLRAPLSNIRWALKLTLAGDFGTVTEEQAKMLGRAYQSAGSMSGLIDDILNISKLDEGKLIYNFSPVSIIDLIEKTMQLFSDEINRKNIQLIFEKPSSPISARGDSEKIKIVLQNLIDNAIRYTPEGGRVTISLKPDKMFLEVMVSDTGIGIPINQQKNIFERFFRANNAIEMCPGGSGLGLFIIKNIIEKHGGKIWFESKQDGGTIFHFTLLYK